MWWCFNHPVSSYSIFSMNEWSIGQNGQWTIFIAQKALLYHSTITKKVYGQCIYITAQKYFYKMQWHAFIKYTNNYLSTISKCLSKNINAAKIHKTKIFSKYKLNYILSLLRLCFAIICIDEKLLFARHFTPNLLIDHFLDKCVYLFSHIINY